MYFLHFKFIDDHFTQGRDHGDEHCVDDPPPEEPQGRGAEAAYDHTYQVHNEHRDRKISALPVLLYD